MNRATIVVKLSLLLFLFAVASTAEWSLQGATGASLDYTVTIQKGDRSAHVKLLVSGVRSSSLTLELRQEARDQGVARYFSNISATSNGRAATVQDLGKGQWRIYPIYKQVIVTYDVAKIIPFKLSPQLEFATGTEVAVYIDDEVGYIMAPFFFLYPANSEISSITLRFNVPSEWQVVTPYLEEDDHLVPQKISRSLLTDFICRQQIYMGKMKFYVEKVSDGTEIRFGIPEGDESWATRTWLATQSDVEEYVDATASVLRAFKQIFGENPFKVYTMYTNFQKWYSRNRWYRYPGTRYFGNGYQYWPEHRWDELVSHMVLSFMHTGWCGPPLIVDWLIEKGIGESYFGHKLAWELFQDPSYLAKTYYYYLLYQRMLASNRVSWNEFQGYVKGEFVGMLLDKEIQSLTNGKRKLADVFRSLYSRYKNTGYKVSYTDLQIEVESLTGASFSSFFSRYVYGNEELPIYSYIQDYKQYFLEYHKILESDVFMHAPFYGHTIPFFILIEMAVSLSSHIPFGIYNQKYLHDFASYMLSHYRIDGITEEDVEEALSKLTGTDSTGFFDRWQDSYGRLSLAELKSWLREYQKHR